MAEAPNPATAPEPSASRRLVIDVYDALNGADLERLLGLLDPDVEWTPLPIPTWTTCHGHDEVRQWWPKREELRVWIGIAAIHLGGEGTAIAEGEVVVGRARSSFIGVLRIRNDRVVAIRHYFSDLETLRRVGFGD
jgi:ketosteroid isomerase-like protein